MEVQLANNKYTISGMEIHDGEAIVYITKKEGNWIIIQSRGIQTDLTTGRWGGIRCHPINLSYISDT